MTTDEKYMHRCLQLAANGCGFVSPNPMVGAVIVHNDQIIGEGFHRQYGGPHAEVNAVESVSDKNLLPESKIYVSLEPCSHYGKTPPCAELIVKHGFKRVVVGTQDPNPSVSGRGIKLIRDAGIDVTVGVLEDEVRQQNKTFLVSQILNRAYVVLKWAQSADGYIDYTRELGDMQLPARFSNEISSMSVHRLRAELDAIMVGTNTARLDNPRLNTRLWYGHNPVRIVIDKKGVMDKDMALFDESSEVIVFTALSDYPVVKDNVSVLVLSFGKEGNIGMLKELHERNISSLLVEGGARLTQSFIDAGLWDEAFIEVSPMVLNKGVAAPRLDLTGAAVRYLGASQIYHLKNKITQNII